MTDFLEELLKQQEEDEEEQVLLRLARKATHPQSGQPEDRDSNENLSGVPTTETLDRRYLSASRRAVAHGPESVSMDDASSAVTTPSMSASSAQFLWDRVRRAYSAARLWQARTVRPGGSSFGTAGQASALSGGLTKQEPAIPGYAALVDAAFARDARRYDGPLRIL